MNKKILNISLILIVILIIVIFSSIYFYITENRATNSVYDDVEVAVEKIDRLENSNMEQATSSNTSTNTMQVDLLELLPFTGAFPMRDVMPFIFEDTTFSNEQILNLGFSKVTKEDWADSYVAEDEIVSIPASVLDGYIKNIFGSDVNYQKESFSNTAYTIDKSVKTHTSTHKVTYVPAEDKYNIELTAGDGIDENYIQLFDPTVSKIKGKLEIEIPYVFVVYGDEPVSKELEDGTVYGGFEYIIYTKCDYPSKTFSDEIARYSDIDDEVISKTEFHQDKHIESLVKKRLADIPKLTLVYDVNEAGTEYVLKEIKR